MVGSKSVCQKIIELGYHQKDGKVRVIPEDNDKFFVTITDAIQACQKQICEKNFGVTMKELINRLVEWVDAHSGDIKDAYVTLRDGSLLFLVIRKEARFDRAFEDSLTDLDLEIANDSSYNDIPMSVLALPNSNEDTLRSFLAPCNFHFNHAG